MKSDFAFLQFSLISIFPFLLIDVIWTMFKAETYFFRERKSHGNGKWENSKMKKVGTLKNSISSLIKITIRPRRQFLKYFLQLFSYLFASFCVDGFVYPSLSVCLYVSLCYFDPFLPLSRLCIHFQYFLFHTFLGIKFLQQFSFSILVDRDGLRKYFTEFWKLIIDVIVCCCRDKLLHPFLIHFMSNVNFLGKCLI